MENNKTIEIAVEVRAWTDKAILVFDGDDEVWIPVSQVEECEDWCLMDWSGRHAWSKKTETITIPEWLAEEKGLV